MKDNVVEMFPDASGYVTSDRNGKTHIDGVYNEGLVAFELDDAVYIGSKGADGVNNPVIMTKESLNRFCIMWLAINDPSVLVCDDEQMTKS